MKSKRLVTLAVTAVALTTAGSAILARNPRRVAQAEESLRLAASQKAEELASQISVRLQFAIEANCGGKSTTEVLELNPDEITGKLIVDTMNSEALLGCSLAGISTQQLLIDGPEGGDMPLTASGFQNGSAHVELKQNGESVEVMVSATAKAGFFRSAISAEAHASRSLTGDIQQISTKMIEAYTEAAPIVQKGEFRRASNQVATDPLQHRW